MYLLPVMIMLFQQYAWSLIFLFLRWYLIIVTEGWEKVDPFNRTDSKKGQAGIDSRIVGD